MPKIDRKTLTPETSIWDLWTKDANGDFHYLGRGTMAELAKHNDVCEANGYSTGCLVLDTDKPPPELPGPVVELRPPYWDIRRGVLVKE